MDLKSTLHLPARMEALPLGQGFARELALLAGFDDARINAIHLACEEAFVAIVNRAAGSENPVVVSGEVTPLALVLTFNDREMLPDPDEDALPRFDAGRLDEIELAGLGRMLIRAAADEALWESMGREGNRLCLTFHRTRPDVTERAAPKIPERADRDAPRAPEQDYRVRRAGNEGDWFRIARVIYRAYGYTHPSDDLYCPDRLRELNRAGRLLSAVAETLAGEIVGHYALELGGLGQVAAGRCEVAETGMAVVDPAHRGRGLMEQMREFLEVEARALGLRGLFSQPVTSHVISQRVNEKFGGHCCALSLAFLADNLRFRAMKRDGSGQRESCLLYFKPLEPPESRRIDPPSHHRTMLLDTYRECGIPVVADETAAPDAGESRVSARYLSALDLGMIRIETVGSDIATVLRSARNELCRKAGARVLYLTVRLTRPGCAEACAAAERLGFFYGGLAPHFDEGEDVLRMQYVDTAFDFGRLAVAAPFAGRLLAYVEADRRRVEQW
ncbi:MAG: ATP-binding protein [Deltaproteobacteria bacterium]|nr:ATP-binding protein [Deltaproteobacteria bacterium]